MGISNPMLSWLTELHAGGAFAGLHSILELGPQDLVLNRRILSDCLARITGRTVALDAFYNGDAANPTAARALYREMGLGEYFSLDLDDARADYRLNLNDVTTLPRRFDIITNFGTAEHVFNVANVVALIHNHLPAGGLALHVLPTRGDYNHGFYNFHSTWFRDLAAANRYDIVNMFCVPNFGTQHHAMDADARAGRRYRAEFIDIAAGDDQAVGDERFALAAFARYARRRLIRSTDSRIYEYIFAALRKTVEAPFKIPQQDYYSQSQK
jgi:SAM-dependent methyltransferase